MHQFAIIMGGGKPTQVQINKNFSPKIINIFLPIILIICFEYPQHMFWLKNKKIIFVSYSFFIFLTESLLSHNNTIQYIYKVWPVSITGLDKHKFFSVKI